MNTFYELLEQAGMIYIVLAVYVILFVMAFITAKYLWYVTRDTPLGQWLTEVNNKLRI